MTKRRSPKTAIVATGKVDSKHKPITRKVRVLGDVPKTPKLTGKTKAQKDKELALAKEHSIKSAPAVVKPVKPVDVPAIPKVMAKDVDHIVKMWTGTLPVMSAVDKAKADMRERRKELQKVCGKRTLKQLTTFWIAELQYQTEVYYYSLPGSETMVARAPRWRRSTAVAKKRFLALAKDNVPPAVFNLSETAIAGRSRSRYNQVKSMFNSVWDENNMPNSITARKEMLAALLQDVLEAEESK